jgi:hypothetical protein
MYNLCRVFKTNRLAVLTVKSGLDPHMINRFCLVLVALLSTNHKCTHPCLLLLRSKRCEVVEDDDARRTQPQSIACGVWCLLFQD